MDRMLWLMKIVEISSYHVPSSKTAVSFHERNRKPVQMGALTTTALDNLLHKCFDLRQFKNILSRVISTGLIQDTYAASRIIKFSTNSQFVHIGFSHKIFTHIKNSNGFTWNTMMRAYIQRSQPQDAIFLYKLMLQRNVSVDNYTFPLMVQACTLRLLECEGRGFHVHIIKKGFKNDVYVNNTLIHFYSECGNLSDARKVFDESPALDSVSWTTILGVYAQKDNVDGAKLIYGQMPERNVYASNTMIALLGRCGKVDEARGVFNQMEEKDLYSWTALISCYEQNEMYKEALDLFIQMLYNKCVVDAVVMVSVLSACANLLDVKTGKMAHGVAVRNGFESYVNLVNALIHMYSSCGEVMSAENLFNSSCSLDQISWNSMLSSYLSCGRLEKARSLFDAMPEKDVISWSTMISGHLQHGKYSETLEHFQEMLLEDVRPDESTLVSAVSACSHLTALDRGKWLHAYIRKNGLVINTILGTTLIDMYMKCGCVENAVEVFSGMIEKGVSSWNALILGFANNGEVDKSLEMFEKMKANKVVPNEITFVSVLGACRHMGLVDAGRAHFASMTRIHKIEPNSKHYGCMVDLLGRAGLLQEAEELIDSMPLEPDIATWGALLKACNIHGDTEMGQRVAQKLIELQPDHDGCHILLSNIYASKGNWNSAMDIRRTMVQQGLVKIPGRSVV